MKLSAFAPIRQKLVWALTESEQLWYALKYTAPVRPLDLIHVNPDNITECVSDPTREATKRRTCLVLDGDWDTNTYPFSDIYGVQMLRAHFENHVSWEETEFYQIAMDKLRNSNDEWWGFNNPDEFQKRCEKLDELYAEIKKNGYQTQRELATSSDDVIYDGNRSLPPELYEVTVQIDRDGNILWRQGRHRLVIAQVLDLDTIPVRVFVRHAEWQRYRDDVYEQGTEDNHPDLQFV